jgi:hypothetical protein
MVSGSIQVLILCLVVNSATGWQLLQQFDHDQRLPRLVIMIIVDFWVPGRAFHSRVAVAVPSSLNRHTLQSCMCAVNLQGL